MVELAVERVVVGKFGRPHGIKGLVRVTSFTEPRENIFSYPHWSIHIGGIWRDVKRTHSDITPQNLITRIEGYDTRERVAELTNISIAVPKSALPPLDEGVFYWHDLVGMNVVHKQGQTLGVVDSMLATGSNDVLVVIGEKRRLIPYLWGDVIQKVDPDQRTITVCWDLDI